MIKKGLSRLRAYCSLATAAVSVIGKESLGVNDDSNALVFSHVPEPDYLWRSNEPVHLKQTTKHRQLSLQKQCAKLGPPKLIQHIFCLCLGTLESALANEWILQEKSREIQFTQ